ncbi:MAG: class I SAM-dependent methyltransferase [Leptolyngbyaceae cyanobacterium RU_5_1]|nr:class I SAM-dependent methyltransferase [Leptolyngbyaceae cyanobacterium RU_5_1]
MKRIFTHISQVNLWQSLESASGRGSEFVCTTSIRDVLPALLQELGIQAILDAPCGDFNWMRHVPLTGIRYTGIDVVPEIVDRNQRQYGTSTIQFKTGDITQNPLPRADLIICRDCLVHLPFWMSSRALQQFKRSGAKYLLTTTYPATVNNNDAPAGSWRAINLDLAPFNFCPPLKRLSDPSDDTGANPDKSLGLWELDAIAPPRISRWSNPQVWMTTVVRQHFNPSWKL